MEPATPVPPLPPPPAGPLTAVQLKRLGEAVDGYRRSGEVYVVMRVSGEAPFEVELVTHDGNAAARVAEEKSAETNQEWVRFGPFRSAPDKLEGQTLQPVAVAICHEPDSDDCSTIGGPKPLPRMDEITGIAVNASLSDGRTLSFTCGPNRPADAVFIGLAAIDKFWLPYLERLYGAEYAAKERRKLLEQIQ